jgi:prohibitin 1
MENQGLPRVVVFGLLGVVLLFIFGSSMFVTINPGQKGVLFEKLGDGLDKETVYGQGLHIIAPWNEMIVYDVKETETFEKMEVLSSNGLSIKIDLSILHKPVADRIGYLHDNLGTNYLEKIIKPAVRSVTRQVIGNYLPEELYNTKRKEIEEEIYKQTLKIVSEKDIDLPAILGM